MKNEIKPLKYVQASKTTMSFHSLADAGDHNDHHNRKKNMYLGVKKTHFFWLDRLYMHRQARFDPETKRWFFPLRMGNVKEIRAKYWHLGQDEAGNQDHVPQNTTTSSEATCNKDLMNEIQTILNKYATASTK